MLSRLWLSWVSERFEIHEDFVGLYQVDSRKVRKSMGLLLMCANECSYTSMTVNSYLSPLLSLLYMLITTDCIVP